MEEFFQLSSKKIWKNFFSSGYDDNEWIFLKKECSRLRIVECGDETPTAMRDTTHLCKVSGRYVRLELKVGAYSL